MWGLRIAVSAFFLAGCATSVSFQVTRPPVWDTFGIQRIAILPFAVSDRTSLQRQAAIWLGAVSLDRIRETNHFILIDPAVISRVQSDNERIGNYVDAVFSGQILSLVVKDSSRMETRVNKETEKEVVYTIYEREVEMTFNYSLTRTEDGTIIGIRNKSDVMYDSYEEESKTVYDGRSRQERSNRTTDGNLKTPEAMVQEIIGRNLKEVGRELAPYTVFESRNLKSESTKDKDIKERSKNAMSLVKMKNYKGAEDAFLGIYQDTKSFESAYNASVLMEAQGDLGGAVSFMQRVFSETGNPKAAAEVTRIQKAMDNASLAAAYRENQRSQDTIIARMVDELSAKMPDGAKVAVINNSQNDRELADGIINGIIAGLQSNNVTIVDRNNRALLEAERNYQLSGYVSDKDTVSIGKEAGINTFILITIAETGSKRYLSVRMLDVERSTILYQSPYTDEMKL